MPVLAAYQAADEEERAFWVRTIEASDQRDADLERAMRLILRSGAIKTTLDGAARFADGAKAALEVFPDSPVRQALMSVADYTVSRVS